MQGVRFEIGLAVVGHFVPRPKPNFR